MGRIKQEILTHLNFRAYYESQGCELGRAGPDVWTKNNRCPFHEEENGSFGVNMFTGQFKCFGCDAKGSVFDFHMRKHGVDFKTSLKQLAEFSGVNIDEDKKPDLLEEGKPKCKPDQAQAPKKISKKELQKKAEQEKNPAIQKMWDDLLKNNTNEKPVFDLLCDRRKIAKEIVRVIFVTGKARFHKNYQKVCVAIPYTTLQGEVLAIQNISVDGEPFPFTAKNGQPANKAFIKGSKAGQACFFWAGADIESAKILIIVESPINAITAYECFPDACCIAIGGSTFTKKVKALIPHIEHMEKIILCFDNDEAGEEATRETAIIIDVLAHPVYSVQWPEGTPDSFDINDYLMAGDKQGIDDLLSGAELLKENPSPIKKKTSPIPTTDDSGLPVFIQETEQLRDDTQAGWNVIQLNNDPPVVFESLTGVVSVQPISKQSKKLSVKRMTPNGLRNRLGKISNWYKKKISKDNGSEFVPIPPLKAVYENMLEDPSQLLYLKGIKYAPFFMADGMLHDEPGYSKESEYILELAPGLTIPEIPNNPTTEEINNARKLIYELVEGFPFTTQAERVHAISLILLPFVREMIKGQTPLHLFEASTPGTGKTLLVEALTYVFLGQVIPTTTEGRNDEEFRKKITAKLVNLPEFIFIDNVKRKIDSGILAAALTAGIWEDRILGATQIVNTPISCGWIATGNNPALSSEIARRTVRIKLDALLDRPWERTGSEYFKHPDLMEWVKKSRGELISGVLILVQAWISKGCRADQGKRLGSFESWSDVMGGIFAVAGIPGFLENLNDFYEDSDSESNVLRSLISSWYYGFGSAEIGVADLFSLVIKHEIPVDIGDKTERSQKTKLGLLLRQLKGRRFSIETEGEDGGTKNSTFQITVGGSLHRAQQWKLKYEKCEPQNIGSHVGSHLKTLNNKGECEPCEPCEPKTIPTRIHIEKNTHNKHDTCTHNTRIRTSSKDQEKGSQGSQGSQNPINLDIYKREPTCEPQNTGSHYSQPEDDEVII